MIRPLQPILVAVLAASLLSGGCTLGKKEPGSPQDASPADLYVRIAAEYYRLGEIDAALENAQKALDEDSDNAQAHNVTATIYQRLEQDQLAEKHFRAALRLSPQDPYTLTAWGNFLCQKGRYSEAQDQYRKALSNPLFNAPWVAETRAGICARTSGRNGEAERHLRRALTANPRFDAALFEMAQLDYSQARYKSARGYLERYFKVRGYSPKSLLLAVQIERAIGSRKRARGYEKLLRTRFPDSPEVLSL